jgi:enoyl-CoA hydratase/carnithine racemase
MISYESQDSVTVVRMEHGKVNAIDIEFFSELKDKFDELEKNSTAAVILTGTGKAFSAGVDLFRVLEGGRNYLERFLPVLVGTLEKLFLFSKPVIAAVNGHAIAGGCLLTCVCDYRIASKGSGTIGVPELLVGVPFPALALEIVRAAVAPQYFQEIVYTGRCYSMEQALQRGMLDEVVDAGDLLERARQVAVQFGTIPLRAFQIAKRQIRLPYLEYGQKFGTSDEELLNEWSAPVTHEIIRSYLQKTIGK